MMYNDAWFPPHSWSFNNEFIGFGNFSPVFIGGLFVLAILAGLLMVALKGYALWHAAKRDEKWWFIALLVINTAGILELVYLFGFAKIFSFKHCPTCHKGKCECEEPKKEA